jgi:hypothetical protein
MVRLWQGMRRDCDRVISRRTSTHGLPPIAVMNKVPGNDWVARGRRRNRRAIWRRASARGPNGLIGGHSFGLRVLHADCSGDGDRADEGSEVRTASRSPAWRSGLASRVRTARDLVPTKRCCRGGGARMLRARLAFCRDGPTIGLWCYRPLGNVIFSGATSGRPTSSWI